jgi:hypothetical protein
MIYDPSYRLVDSIINVSFVSIALLYIVYKVLIHVKRLEKNRRIEILLPVLMILVFCIFSVIQFSRPTDVFP